MAAIAVNASEDYVLGFDDGAGLEAPLECPEYSKEAEEILVVFAYWCEGVVLSAVAVAGVIGNTLSVLVLSTKNMRNSFNLLLIALAVYDTMYLVGAFLEAFRKSFDMFSYLHRVLFPNVIYPLHSMAMTGSIMMTVAIALERYVAVHYPINYSQAMNDSRELKRRLMKYLIPVVALSIAMNVTKFFEIRLVFDEYVVDTVDGYNITEWRPNFHVTQFRKDPTYSIPFNWFRFISIGILPFVLLVFFNLQIYVDIRRRNLRKAATIRSARQATMSHSSVIKTRSAVGRANSANPTTATTAAVNTFEKNGNGNNDGSGSVARGGGRECVMVTRINEEGPATITTATSRATAANANPTTTAPTTADGNNASGSAAAAAEATPLLTCKDGGSGERQVGTGNGLAAAALGKTAVTGPVAATNGAAAEPEEIEMTEKAPVTATASTATVQSAAAKGSMMSKQLNRGYKMVHNAVVAANDARRRVESNLAAIMMGYVLVFLICNFPRLMLNIDELARIRNVMWCAESGQRQFPLWTHYVMYVSHLLLVINSSINIIIYSCLSSKFRQEGRALILRCCCFNKSNSSSTHTVIGRTRQTQA